jgi:hypothetical protein
MSTGITFIQTPAELIGGQFCDDEQGFGAPTGPDVALLGAVEFDAPQAANIAAPAIASNVRYVFCIAPPVARPIITKPDDGTLLRPKNVGDA